LERLRKLNSVFLLFVGLLLLATSVSQAQTKNTPSINVYDGFETEGLSKVWDTDRFVPGAVTMQTNIVRAGHGAARITVHANEKFEAGINGNSDSERAELLEARTLTSKENVTYEHSVSMFIPADFPIVPTRLVIAQWKQYCPKGGNCFDDSPVLAVRYIAGVLKVTQNISKKETILFEKKDEYRNRWLDFKFQVRFSTNDTGRVKAWLSGQQIVNFTGATAYPETAAAGYSNPSRFYFKMGLYRNVMAEPMTIYVDEYRKKQLPGE
jgi:hypothetical protein